jgi:hypothetical protein
MCHGAVIAALLTPVFVDAILPRRIGTGSLQAIGMPG